MGLNDTPRADRLHIGLFGKRNSGKSSLINALTGQDISLVSPVAGTTTDPVYKAFELRGVGPVVFIDTAGLDDAGELGALRVQKTKEALEETDVAILVLTGRANEELAWYRQFQEKKLPVLAVLNQCDQYDTPEDASAVLAELSAAGRKTAVVDERFEIAPVEQSGFCTRLPQHCDVLSGYPKHIGMQHALRALAPDVIVCDEVGAMEDIAAITQAANAGVGLVVTIHAPDAETLRRRPQYTALLQTGAFRHVAFLKGKETPGRISEVVDAGTVF